MLAGAAAGVLGAIAVAAAASPLEDSTAAAILPSTSIGLIGGFLFAAALGVGFSLLISRQRRGPGEALFWGVSYGFLVWVVFSLTLWPLINYQRFSWDLPAAQAALPTLFANLLFGALMALFHAVLTAPSLRSARPPWRSMVLGLTAGLIAIGLLRLLLSTQADQMVAQAMMPQAMQTPDPRLLLYLVGVLAGIILALLYPGGFTGVGEGLIRGGLYGFVWWVLGARTLFPILTGGPPEWT